MNDLVAWSRLIDVDVAPFETVFQAYRAGSVDDTRGEDHRMKPRPLGRQVDAILLDIPRPARASGEDVEDVLRFG